MHCATCQQETPDGKKFCVNCGVPLAQGCLNCGAELIAGKPFCAECGASVESNEARTSARSAAPILARAPANPVAERRLCSILFVDLVGFTPLAERRDAEQVRELLSEYFDRAQRIVDAYGGTIEKFIGDAVMAVWGAPTANEDDAERAVRAALEIVDAVTALGRDVSLPDLRARGGVVTGEVAITIGKVSEGMILGDAVNTASRIQGEAAPGTVLVDESTWRATSESIAFEAVEALSLKGKADSVRAWRALRVVAQRRGLGRTERLEPPFVGRDEEIRLIKDLLHATAREQRARLVSVTGIPGIGKSRLSWEFLKYVDGLADDVYWHQGRSRTFGEGVSFGALAEMVRMRAEIQETDDDRVSMDKLRACVERFVTDEDERQWIEPRVAHLVGLAEAPPGDREELFSAWRTFFERIAERGLTVLVFEDLQWADPGLIDYVETIPDRSRNRPILVISLSRPELIQARPSWGAGQRNFSSLHLEPLTSDVMRALLAGLVVGLPESAIDHVLERAEGVPLYAVEMIRMLLDRGVLAESDGEIRVVGSIDRLEIPETLHALIASRLDALSAELRSVLQDAGVVGSTFFAATVAVVCATSVPLVEAQLHELVARELLYVDDDPRSPERGQFTFVQALIREVAVGMMSRRDRSTKHLAVARHMESLCDEDLADVVAAQYVEALQSAPDDVDRTELEAKAVDWLLRAGQRANLLGSPVEARINFERALSLGPVGADRAGLLEALARTWTRAVDPGVSLEFLHEAIALYRSAEDRLGVARVATSLAMVLDMLNVADDGLEIATAAFEALADDDDVKVRAELASGIGRALSNGGRIAEAMSWLETGLDLSERADDPVLFARALGNRSLALYQLGRHREAALLARGMIDIADASGALAEQASARMGLSLYSLPDDPVLVMSLAAESAELSHRAGNFAMEHTNYLNIAETGIYMGRWAVAGERIAQAMAMGGGRNEQWMTGLDNLLRSLKGDDAAARALLEVPDLDPYENVDGYTTILCSQATVHLALGDPAAAYELAARAVEASPTGINAMQCLIVASRGAMWLGDSDKARTVIAGMDRIHGKMVTAAKTSLRAGVAALEGHIEEAADLYRECFELWRGLDNLLELAHSETELVQQLGAAHLEAAVAKEAIDIFTEMGAMPFLSRLQRLLV